MMENIEHHAFEEEEGEMFPTVRRAFKKDELEDLGARTLRGGGCRPARAAK
jgi:hypothetical protein